MEAKPANDVTVMLQAIAGGDRRAAEELLPIVYEELRRLARARMSQESPGQTLQPTALVHEAYLKLVGEGSGTERGFNGRQHFFATAALAMRQILVDRARQRGSIKRGGGLKRAELREADAVSDDDVDLVELDGAIRRLEAIDPRRARVVTLRYFGGLSVEETGALLEVSPATVKNDWAFARAWLLRALSEPA